MALTIIGVFLGTLAEGIGFLLWQQDPGSASGLSMLIAGGLFGWFLTALLVRFSQASHPRRADKVGKAIVLLFGLALFKVLLWLAWYWILNHSDLRFHLTLATAFLIIGFHFKHVLGIVQISGRSIQPTTWNPVTILATLSAAGGAAVWMAIVEPYGVYAALAVWLIYSFAENMLQFLAGGLFDPPSHAQSPFSIVTEVDRNRVHAVKTIIAPYRAKSQVVRAMFQKYTRLHFCSFILIEREGDNATLIFEGNIDGPALSFLKDLADRDRQFLNDVYRDTKKGNAVFPILGTTQEVADFLAENDYGASAMYVGQPGVTRDHIERDEMLRKLVETELDANHPNYASLSADDCRTAIQKFVETQPDFAWTKEPVPMLLRVRFGKKVLVLALVGITIGLIGIAWATIDVDGYFTLLLATGAVVAGIGFAIFFYLRWLNHRENTDVANRVVAPLGHLLDLQGYEDLQMQNHLVSITDVKDGWLRLLTMRAVLMVIDIMAKYISTRGNLSGIVTIHFARWVVLTAPNRTPRLLFLSNYDGSWENYLGEFVDRASNGLTAVWSNTQLGPDRGFPTTHGLFVAGGSRDEQWFKNYARTSQRTDLLWYSDYPELTMKHITNNREFRLGLFGPVTDTARWLQRL